MKEDELRSAFEARLPHLKAFGKWIESELVSRLSTEVTPANLDQFLKIPIKSRVKTVDSFLEKALIRKKKTNPLEEIEDQVGLRVVVLLLPDIDLVGRVIEAGPWSAHQSRDHFEERLQRPDYFAYQSDHWIIRTKGPIRIDDLEITTALSCEIQVRTLLQHAYAEMAHSSDYKPSIRLPETDQQRVRRALAKGSALVETTDDVFKEIRREFDDYNSGTNAVLEQASASYASLTGIAVPSRTTIGNALADAYRATVKHLSAQDLKTWAEGHAFLGDAIKTRRQESVLFRDGATILAAWLVEKQPLGMLDAWPFDERHLEELFLAMGISPNGVF